MFWVGEWVNKWFIYLCISKQIYLKVIFDIFQYLFRTFNYYVNACLPPVCAAVLSTAILSGVINFNFFFSQKHELLYILISIRKSASLVPLWSACRASLKHSCDGVPNPLMSWHQLRHRVRPVTGKIMRGSLEQWSHQVGTSITYIRKFICYREWTKWKLASSGQRNHVKRRADISQYRLQ